MNDDWLDGAARWIPAEGWTEVEHDNEPVSDPGWPK